MNPNFFNSPLTPHLPSATCYFPAHYFSINNLEKVVVYTCLSFFTPHFLQSTQNKVSKPSTPLNQLIKVYYFHFI